MAGGYVGEHEVRPYPYTLHRGRAEACASKTLSHRQTIIEAHASAQPDPCGGSIGRAEASATTAFSPHHPILAADRLVGPKHAPQ
jgi:hypothetical protein